MSLQEHVDQNASPHKEAQAALLAAIAKEVAESSEGTSLDHRISRLKSLSEAYALVIHGKA